MELGWRELGSQVKETTLPSPQQKVHDGVPFPLILTPTNPDDFPTIESTLEWMRKKRAAVEEKLLKYGAVLFRGFPLQEASHFNDFVNIFEYDPLPYIGGSAPRNQVRQIDIYLVKQCHEYYTSKMHVINWVIYQQINIKVALFQWKQVIIWIVWW